MNIMALSTTPQPLKYDSSTLVKHDTINKLTMSTKHVRLVKRLISLSDALVEKLIHKDCFGDLLPQL